MEIINSIPGYGTCWYSGPACALSSGGKISAAQQVLGKLPLSYTHSPSDASQAAYREAGLVISNNHGNLGTDLTTGLYI